MATIDNEQLEIAKKYLAALAEIEKIQSKIEQSYSSQLKLADQLAAALNKPTNNSHEQDINSVSEALKRVTKSLDEFDTHIGKSFGNVGAQASKAFTKVTKQSSDTKQSIMDLSKQFSTVSTNLSHIGSNKSLRGLNDDTLRSIQSNAQLIDGIEKTVGISKILNVLGLKGFARAFKNPVEASKALHVSSEDLAKKFEKRLPKSLIVFGAALSGMVQGFRNVMGLSKGILGFLGSVTDAAFNVAASIVAIPFKIFYGIVDIADKGSLYFTELLQAIENLRKAFGDIRGPTNSTIKELTHSMTGFKDTGLSTWRVFGNLAERMAYIQPIVEAMGSTFQVLRQEFFDNGGALLGYQKALGLTAEQMQDVGSRAISLGDTMADTFKGVAKYALDLGKAFKIDSKILSRDMTKALADVKHFANLSVKEIGIASVYAKKLGVELDKITSTLDAFETFDSAAENVSKLSQSFGVQVDAFELMEAQNPAEQIDKLRRAFKDAGQDASTFSRQQLKLLSQTTGLDEITARQVFSVKNYGVSLDQVRKKAGETEKKTLTQAEAMAKLASNIERLVKVMGPGGHFVERFFKGFLTGFQSTQETYGAFLKIRQALELTQMAGVSVGRAFVKAFPGVAQFFQGIQEVFDTKRFAKFTKNIQKVFEDFFKELGEGKVSFKTLIEKLQASFFEQFDKSSPGVQKITGGFKTFATTIRNIAVSALDWASTKIASTIDSLAELIANPDAFFAKAKSQTNTLGSKAISFFMPIVEALTKAAQKIWPKIKKLFGAAAAQLITYLSSDEFKSLLKPLYPIMAAAFFGPIFVKTIASALATSLISAVTKGITGETAAASSGGIKAGLTKFGAKFGVKAATSITVGIVAAAALVATGISDGLEKYKDAIEGGFSDVEKTIGAGTAGLADMLTFGLLPQGLTQSIAQTITEVFSGVGSVLDGFLPGFGNALLTTIGDAFNILGDVGDIISGIFSGDTDKILDSIGNLGKDLVVGIINTLFRLPGAIGINAFKISGQIISGVVGLLSGALERIAKWLGLDAAAKFFGGIKEFASNTSKQIKEVFGALGEFSGKVFDGIANFIKGDAKKAASEAKKATETIAAAPTQAFEQAKVDFNKDPTGYVSVAQNVVEGIKSVQEALGSIKISEVSDSLQKLSQINLPEFGEDKTKAINSYSTFFESYSGFLSKITDAAKEIKKSSVSQTINAVNEMINVANKLQDSLGDGAANKIDISTRLNRVAQAAGLGSQGTYTIKNKDVVVNLSLTVYMDVAETERIMVTSQKSILRDRLNTIAESVPSLANQPNFPVKTNTTPALIKGGEK